MASHHAGVAFDLHNHTSRSKDCALPPRRLVDIAAFRGLAGIGVCDHDELPDEGLYAHARRKGVKLALGVEISCRGAHVIGYDMDLASPALAGLVARFETLRRNYEHVSRRILAGLRKRGIHVAFEAVRAYAGKTPQKIFIAKYLAEEMGLFASWGHAMRYLHDEGLYIPDDAGVAALHPARAVETVRAAGGFAVWAHPFQTAPRRRGPYLAAMLDAGLDGIEGVYAYSHNGYKGPESDAELADQAQDMAKRHKLAILGGSDSHYPVKTRPDRRPIAPGDHGLTAAQVAPFAHIFH
ncbi:MAG: PHP domain-containing protein [Desulfovibrionaceae bacterium]